MYSWEQVEYVSHSFPGTYYARQLTVTQAGVSRTVTQIHCTAWKDLAAPDDTQYGQNLWF